MGNEGVTKAAEQSMSKAHYMAEKLAGAGFKVEIPDLAPPAL